MSEPSVMYIKEIHAVNWIEVATKVGEGLSRRAAGYDESNEFVAENYEEMRERKLFSAGIPGDLGGGGASHSELAAVIRELGRHCGSTALAFSMHTHPVLANVFKHQRGDEAASRVLKKIAANELIIATTGANDWLESSGSAQKVEGGYRVNARKRFVSGCPGAQVFVTSVGFDGDKGKEVLHFSTPMQAEDVTIVETWNTIGMRGTGSHDVVLDGVFIADESIILRRPSGVWHPVWNVIIPVAMPLISSAYLGLADAATELALNSAVNKHRDLAPAIGEMMNSYTVSQMAVADMVRIANDLGFSPGLEVTSEILTRKAIATGAIKQTVEYAAEVVGGPGFYRGHPMERIVRDVRAMHFHPLPLKRQQVFSGRVALGVDPVNPG